MEPRIYKAIHLMTADLRRNIQLDDLANSLHLSTSRLRRLFKKEIGISPAQYLKIQRMQKAKELVENTFLNIKEMMLKVGFKDRSHFVRDFKKAYGLSPSQYRKPYFFAKQSSQAIAKSATK